MKRIISKIKNMDYRTANDRKQFQISSSDLFIFAYCLYTATLLIESTTVTIYHSELLLGLLKGIRYFSYALCIIKVFVTAKYKYMQIICAVVFFLVVMITLCTSDRSLAMLSFIFMGAVGVPKNKVLKCYLRVQVALLILTIVCSLFGFIDNYLFDPFRGRWGLGFIWTTFAPILFMFFTFEYVYLYNRKIRLYHFIILGVVATYFYFMTKTRFAYATTVFFLLISMIEHYKKKPWKIIKRLGKWNMLWPILFAVFAIVLQISYNQESTTWQKIDILLSRRLYNGLNAINKYQITAFGQKIEWIGHSYNTELKGLIPSNDLIDNAYYRNLFLYGIVGLGTILSVYVIGIWKAVRYKDYFLVWIYIVILGFCVFEFWMYNLQMNPFALVAVMSFSMREKNYLLCTKKGYKEEKRLYTPKIRKYV